MTFNSLLPVRNRTPVEVQLEQMMAFKFESLDADMIRKIHEPDECPLALLPWLAWSLSVDEWDDRWSESVKRSVIRESIDIHRHKGTPYAVKKALLAIGYDHVVIKEARYRHRNGAFSYNGKTTHGDLSVFPQFDVYLNIGYMPVPTEIEKIRTRIERYKNKRSVLRNLVFMNIYHNGAISRNGAYRYNGGVL